MRLVVDANVLLSALIADSKTRELLVTLEPNLLTPEVIEDELDKYDDLIVEKSGMSTEKVSQFLDVLFQYIEIVPTDELVPEIDRAEDALSETDPDDMLYLACALARDAAIWSDDTDFEAQSLVPVYTTTEVIESFEIE